MKYLGKVLRIKNTNFQVLIKFDQSSVLARDFFFFEFLVFRISYRPITPFELQSKKGRNLDQSPLKSDKMEMT